MNVEITVHVPVRLEGEAKAVLQAGGLVDRAVDSITVSCTPANLPNEIVIDVTDLQPGQVIHLSQVTVPKGVTVHGDPATAVVSILHTAAEVAPAPAAPAAPAE